MKRVFFIRDGWFTDKFIEFINNKYGPLTDNDCVIRFNKVHRNNSKIFNGKTNIRAIDSEKIFSRYDYLKKIHDSYHHKCSKKIHCCINDENIYYKNSNFKKIKYISDEYFMSIQKDIFKNYVTNINPDFVISHISKKKCCEKINQDKTSWYFQVFISIANLKVFKNNTKFYSIGCFSQRKNINDEYLNKEFEYLKNNYNIEFINFINTYEALRPHRVIELPRNLKSFYELLDSKHALYCENEFTKTKEQTVDPSYFKEYSDTYKFDINIIQEYVNTNIRCLSNNLCLDCGRQCKCLGIY